MVITQAEFQANVPKYLELAKFEDINIYQDDMPVAKMSSLNKNSKDNDRARKWLDSISGIISSDITLEEAREERLSQK